MKEVLVQIKKVMNGYIVTLPLSTIKSSGLMGLAYNEQDYSQHVFDKYLDAAAFLGNFFKAIDEAESVSSGGVQ